MPDFGFVGTSYEAPSIYQDAQECINFYAEPDPTKAPGSRGIVALYPSPGLQLQVQLPVEAPIRAMRALSGSQWLIAVAGNNVYSIDRAFTATLIGKLATSAGLVTLTDNVMTTEGLTCYIVDGVNRYTWVAATNTFTQLPSTDGPWQGATYCDVVDNYVIYNESGSSQNWSCTDLGSPLSNAVVYGTADASPDPIKALIADRRQVYLLKEQTTEVWTDVGNVIQGIVGFPFGRVPGTMFQAGITAPGSLARYDAAFMFVARDTRGDATIQIVDGYSVKRISTFAVEQSLLGYVVNDATAYSYQIEGHEFYVVTFPSVGPYGLTWVYDSASQAWHKWLSWDAELSVFKRHRSNCHAFFANENLVGDYENGKIYAINNNYYTEDGAPIRRLRRAIHLTSDLQRQYFEELQLQFQPGVGLTGYDFTDEPVPLLTEAGDELLTEDGKTITASFALTQGANPQVMLRWSNDGGSTWSNEHWTSIGRIGKYKNRAIWRRLGQARDRIFEVSITDPVKAVIVSANLKASVGEN